MPYGINKATGKPGPAPKPPRDNDKVQARQRINVEVRTGRRPHPNTLPCVDCGHVWSIGDSRHEYDHFLGYGSKHHYDVEPVCSMCHDKRDNEKKKQMHCVHGHEFTPQNTKYRANGTRECRTCRKQSKKLIRTAQWWREYRIKKKANNGNKD